MLFEKISWKFHDYEQKTDLTFFNRYLRIGTHYTGVKCYGIELSFTGGCWGLLNFIRPWWLSWNKKGVKVGKPRSFTLRTGRHILTLHLSKESRNRSVESINLYRC